MSTGQRIKGMTRLRKNHGMSESQSADLLGRWLRSARSRNSPG
jgi:hypothetical protein